MKKLSLSVTLLILFSFCSFAQAEKKGDNATVIINNNTIIEDNRTRQERMIDRANDQMNKERDRTNEQLDKAQRYHERESSRLIRQINRDNRSDEDTRRPSHKTW